MLSASAPRATLRAFKSLWGVVAADGGRKTLLEVVEEVASDGRYAGIECSLKLADTLERAGQPFRRLLADHGLQWIPVVFSSGPIWGGWDPFLAGDRAARSRDSPKAQVAALEDQIASVQRLGLSVPFFNAHTGHDSFTEDQAGEVLGLCQDMAARMGVEIAHEIHRGRVTSNPWQLARLLGRPELAGVRVVADYSHFLAACEAEPGDAALEEALSALHARARHVHARVGFGNGPQARKVGDPRDPLWASHTEAHVRWWVSVWRAQRQAGESVMTITPEHGPFPYQPTAWAATALVARGNPPFPVVGGPSPAIVFEARGAGGHEDCWLMPEIEEVNDWVLERVRKAFVGEFAERI